MESVLYQEAMKTGSMVKIGKRLLPVSSIENWLDLRVISPESRWHYFPNPESAFDGVIKTEPDLEPKAQSVQLSMPPWDHAQENAVGTHSSNADSGRQHLSKIHRIRAYWDQLPWGNSLSNGP
jgi:hypothetical protein